MSFCGWDAEKRIVSIVQNDDLKIFLHDSATCLVVRIKIQQKYRWRKIGIFAMNVSTWHGHFSMIFKKHAESPFYSATPLIGLQTGKYMLNYNCRGDKLPNTIEQGVHRKRHRFDDFREPAWKRIHNGSRYVKFRKADLCNFFGGCRMNTLLNTSLPDAYGSGCSYS